ncbi:hypothetical protein BGZ63DRAFT_421564 [Mariannaea sp. PMI_226]|nr:hypothetical protein BGZ63DRAFT_421564 [Mariannaea sp. PMI_226]
MPPFPVNPNYTAADFLSTQQRHYASEDLIISCGCVPVDPVARKIAILRKLSDPEIVSLPKGRKNIGEDIHAAALRETYEETGIRFTELKLRTATRATPTPNHNGYVQGENPSVAREVPNNEVSSVCLYPDISTGCFKIVFWFPAEGDSTHLPDDGTREHWEMNTVVEWVDADAAASRMSFEADKKVIEKVLTDMRRTGYSI